MSDTNTRLNVSWRQTVGLFRERDRERMVHEKERIDGGGRTRSNTGEVDGQTERRHHTSIHHLSSSQL